MDADGPIKDSYASPCLLAEFLDKLPPSRPMMLFAFSKDTMSPNTLYPGHSLTSAPLAFAGGTASVERSSSSAFTASYWSVGSCSTEAAFLSGLGSASAGQEGASASGWTSAEVPFTAPSTTWIRNEKQRVWGDERRRFLSRQQKNERRVDLFEFVLVDQITCRTRTRTCTIERP